MRNLPPFPWFELAGEGNLYLGGCAQGTRLLQVCPVARLHAPPRGSSVDKYYLSNYDGTRMFQWIGRKADGRFYPFGNILRLTKNGKKALKQFAANAEDYEKTLLERLQKNLRRATA